MKTPKTLQEAIAYFADPERCFCYAVELRWPGGKVTCPRCGHAEHSFIKTRLLWFCKGCKKQFTVKVGTIFEDSALGLDKWMTAVWMIVNAKNGVSSHELARSLGVTQKSAWFMLHRIREALKQGSFLKFGNGGNGEVESDETFVGGKTKNMHKERRLKIQRERNEIPDWKAENPHMGKTPVMGMLDRDLRKVRAMVLPNIKRETLQYQILNQVNFGAKLYTDQAKAYEPLGSLYAHDVVNHEMEYVRGRVHTNGLENFWSLLKRTLHGTYVAVEPFHLDRYVDEQVFRYNNRKDMNDADRFNLAMSRIAGKRLTYSELTGKGTDALHSSETGAREADAF
jgi:transposase-like protein